MFQGLIMFFLLFLGWVEWLAL